jgi:glycosyltransferase involved in cell wall biosynthesis/SAM-dependent methyltransferase
MFDNIYHGWNRNRSKAILDFYTVKFFYFKKVLDLGCGYGDLGGVLYRLGSDVTGIDARQDHLKVTSKKYRGIKTVQANLDTQWPFHGQKFDLILDLGLMCHLGNYEQHLKAVCASTTHLVLETAVCDSDDPNKVILVDEDRATYDLAYGGKGSRPSAAAIERVLKENGMNFKRMDSSKLNAGDYVYDWYPRNDNSTNINKRRIWFAVKENSPVQFANPNSELASPPGSMPSPRGHIAPMLNVVPPPSAKASPKPPMMQGRTIPSAPQPIVASSPSNSHTMATAPVSSNSPPVYVENKKKFVIVIPSYKNEKWCEKNITSTLNQNYPNYRVIFTDDCSPDNTFNRVSEIVSNHPNSQRFTLIRNTERIGALANLYNMIVSCRDDEIILTLDGDDWLAHDNVLTRLNEVYADGSIWMTYGQYKNSTDGALGIAKSYPAHVVAENRFRESQWAASHLRTFYTWLFKKINKDDLMQDGKFFSMTWDFAIMFPMLEMSGSHSKFLSDVLYVYNLDNPINDHKVNARLQQNLDRHIRAKTKYGKLESAPVVKSKVGLLLIATNKYYRFLQDLITSADQYFLKNDGMEITYYILSDQVPKIQTNRQIIYIPIEHKPFPYASMDRFKHFSKNATTLSQEDYLYYVDVDCKFVDVVGQEIIGDLVGVRHCGYYNRTGPVESNPASCLFVDINTYPKKWKHYYGGGFSGGKSGNYLTLARWCLERIDRDLSNNIIPGVHDESVLNRYFLDNEPSISLSPSYHYPQSDVARYKRIWAPDTFTAKILLLDKNHKEIRS